VLASATFDEESQAKRPSVQVADPFREKLLIEACLELAEKGLLQGLQDLGGAGFTCATCETASRGHRGMRVWMDRVPLREPSMEPFEVAMSESQERMLAIVAPSDADEVEAICARWGVPATRIGEVTEGSILEVHWKGEIVASIPARSLADEGPVYERPMERPEWLDRVQATDLSRLPVPEDLGEALVKILSDPNQADAAWVYEQYDFLVQHNTLEGPTGDAAVLRLPNSSRGIAISTDGNGHYSYLDPYTGAALSTAEAARNVACTGAQPVAVTNCLNFGNPENPNVMWQFAEVIRGMGDACRSLGTPVTGGNVSFYNETTGEAIHPTPVVGVLGLLEDVERRCGNAFRASGDAVWLLGPTMVEFGGSEYSRIIHGVLGGLPPSIDLDLEARLHKLLVESISAGLLSSAHDLSEGGLGVALAESAIAGGIGADLHLPQRKAPHVWLFSESASRVLVSVCPEAEDDLRAMADRWEVPALRLGQVGGDRVNIDGVLDLSVTELGEARRSPLPRLMSEGL
jgi:phosphoribosylformylglycinamidine synthase